MIQMPFKGDVTHWSNGPRINGRKRIARYQGLARSAHLQNCAVLENELKRSPRKAITQLQSGMGVAVCLAEERFDQFGVRHLLGSHPNSTSLWLLNHIGRISET